MKIRISEAGAGLEEPDDFKGFAIVAEGSAANIDRLKAGLPRGIAFEGDGHAWVDVSWLEAELGIPANAERAANFEKMMGYARSKGWTRGDPEAVRGHIEWQA